MTQTVELIRNAMDFSQTEWKLAHRGELSTYGMFPIDRSMTAMQMEAIKEREKLLDTMSEDQRKAFLSQSRIIRERHDREVNDPTFVFVECVKALNLMWVGLFEEDKPAAGDWHNFQKDLICDEPPNYKKTMLRLAALISCGFGTGASSGLWIIF